MTENFERAPGAGRASASASARLPSPGLGEEDTRAPSQSLFNQLGPLRQPRTSPPFAENNTHAGAGGGGDGRGSGKPHPTAYSHSPSSSKGHKMDSVVQTSTLSVHAAEFVPNCSVQYEEPVWDDGSSGSYEEASLSDMVQEFLGHLSSSPGSFESDVEHIAHMLNSWVTTEDMLQELVELIYTQSTTIPNFAYTGARLCNFLSHHLAITPASGNFRQLLLKRCQTEFEQRTVAVRGCPKTQKSFHCYVLFLGELYLNLELKAVKGPPRRAEILLVALRELMNALLSNPVDANLICAVKLLKLTGSVLEDTWKESGKPDMDQLIQRMENIVLDATCSRDVKQMLLRLVELRSSNWGRVLGPVAASDATPDNDPNYFMNEPTFYTTDGTPFTAADPEYSEKYQEILDRDDWVDPDEAYEENGTDSLYDEDEMDPEIEEAFEKFCLESEKTRRQ